jgi:hypothetical protein
VCKSKGSEENESSDGRFLLRPAPACEEHTVDIFVGAFSSSRHICWLVARRPNDPSNERVWRPASISTPHVTKSQDLSDAEVTVDRCHMDRILHPTPDTFAFSHSVVWTHSRFGETRRRRLIPSPACGHAGASRRAGRRARTDQRVNPDVPPVPHCRARRTRDTESRVPPEAKGPRVRHALRRVPLASPIE